MACVTMDMCLWAWSQSSFSPVLSAFSTASARPGKVGTLDDLDAHITCLCGARQRYKWSQTGVALHEQMESGKGDAY